MLLNGTGPHVRQGDERKFTGVKWNLLCVLRKKVEIAWCDPLAWEINWCRPSGVLVPRISSVLMPICSSCKCQGGGQGCPGAASEMPWVLLNARSRRTSVLFSNSGAKCAYCTCFMFLKCSRSTWDTSVKHLCSYRAGYLPRPIRNTKYWNDNTFSMFKVTWQ